MSATTAPKRRRFTVAALAAGLIGTAAMSLSLTGTLSGFVATITNSQNTAAVAALAVSETSGSVTCNSYDGTATCSNINKYGGTATPLVPGKSQTVTVQFANTGSVDVGSSSLTAGACTATSTGVVGSTSPASSSSAPGNVCSVLTVSVYPAATATGTPLYTGALSGFTGPIALGTLAKGATQSYTFVTSLPSSATTAIQGQQVAQALTWTYNQ